MVSVQHIQAQHNISTATCLSAQIRSQRIAAQKTFRLVGKVWLSMNCIFEERGNHILSAISSEWSTCFCSGHLGPRGEFTAGVMCAVSLGTIEVLGFERVASAYLSFQTE